MIVDFERYDRKEARVRAHSIARQTTSVQQQYADFWKHNSITLSRAALSVIDHPSSFKDHGSLIAGLIGRLLNIAALATIQSNASIQPVVLNFPITLTVIAVYRRE